MSDNSPALKGSTDGGASGSHVNPDSVKLLVAPSTAAGFNTVRLRLIPVACWRVDDIRFAFDSSFVLPDITDEIHLLAKLISDHSTRQTISKASLRPPPISIFGHADPVGTEDYNKKLSGRRAAAIYGLLTRREEVWEDLFSNGGAFTHPVAGDRWGSESIQIMLDSLNAGDVRDFQTNNDLAVDGDAGPATRKQLFRAYMDNICVDGKGQSLRIDRKAGFLTQNQDPSGKGDFQGCGEFNPALIFSQNDETRFEQADDHEDRNAANAPNRRVMVLLFRPGSQVDPIRWPCPSSREGVEKCKKRFFSDSSRRLADRLPDEPRTFEKTADTFACRFYHRLVISSPCEGFQTQLFQIALVLRSNSGALVIRNEPYRLTLKDGQVVIGETDQDGNVFLDHVEAGDHLFEIRGIRIFVPAMPRDAEARLTRVPGFRPVQ